MPTDQNPADIGSRDGSNSALWMNGPPWLPSPDKWPPNIDIELSTESRAEAKETKEVLATALPMKDEFSELMDKHSLWKTLHVYTWFARFLINCRSPKSRRMKGLLSTDEIKCEETWWTTRVQAEATRSKNFQADKLQLNLQTNASGILECRGSIVGVHSIYLSDDNLYTYKFVQLAHLATLHEGVVLTITKV